MKWCFITPALSHPLHSPRALLRLTCPEVSLEQRRLIAAGLADEIEALFFNPRGGPSRAELGEHTTVHFQPYGEGELSVGARTPGERRQTDLTLGRAD